MIVKHIAYIRGKRYILYTCYMEGGKRERERSKRRGTRHSERHYYNTLMLSQRSLRLDYGPVCTHNFSLIFPGVINVWRFVRLTAAIAER